MANANVLTVNDANFDAEVLKSDKPVLVDFWAPWCGPCVQLGPVIDQVADATVGKAKVAKVNVDESAQLAASDFAVNSDLRLAFVFKGGEFKEQLNTRSKGEMVAKLESLA